MQCCPLLAAYLPVVLHVGVVFVKPAGQVEDGVRGPLLGHLGEPLGQTAAQVELQVLRVHAAVRAHSGGRVGGGDVVTFTGARSERRAETFVFGYKVRTRRIKETKVNRSTSRDQPWGQPREFVLTVVVVFLFFNQTAVQRNF